MSEHAPTVVTRRWLAWAALIVLWGLAPAAWAQAGGLVLEAAASPFECLKPSRAERAPLVYPDGAADRKLGAVVRVRLRFTDASAPPRAEVFYNSGAPVFEDAVLATVKSYRLPCLAPAGAEAVATQEFQFLPGDGRRVIWGQPHDEETIDRTQLECLRGGPKDRPPRYPRAAALERQSGTVLVRVKFESPVQGPTVTVLIDSGAPRLARWVKDYVEGYRLPCLAPGQAPVQGTQLFTFLMDSEDRVVLNDMSLRQFIGAIDKLDAHKVRFDFGTMACPFEVRLVSYQPHLPNQVGEVGSTNPNRREFVEWLKTVSLRLPAAAKRQVVGDTTTLAVPCGVLDLL